MWWGIVGYLLVVPGMAALGWQITDYIFGGLSHRSIFGVAFGAIAGIVIYICVRAIFDARQESLTRELQRWQPWTFPR